MGGVVVLLNEDRPPVESRYPRLAEIVVRALRRHYAEQAKEERHEGMGNVESLDGGAGRR
jgi:hypothetical protein